MLYWSLKYRKRTGTVHNEPLPSLGIGEHQKLQSNAIFGTSKSV